MKISRGIYEVSRQSIKSYSSKELALQSYLIVKTSCNEDKCEQAVELNSWKKMSDCYYGFVEEHVGKNMVTVAFIDDMNTISIALVSKKSALFVADGMADKDSFGLGTRVAICVEKNQADEITKHGKAPEYKGVLLFKQMIIENEQETYQMLIRGGFSDDILKKLKQFLPSDVSVQPMRFAATSCYENQPNVLLVTSNSRKHFVLCKTVFKAECHLMKEVPHRLRRNVEDQNQVFSAIVQSHPGVCLQLNSGEDNVLIACSSSVAQDVNLCFDTEIKRYMEIQTGNKEGYSSSDSLEYEPAQDDDEILSKTVGDGTNLSKNIQNKRKYTDFQDPDHFVPGKGPRLMEINERNYNIEDSNSINTVASNVAKMLSEKIFERRKRMESDEKELQASRQQASERKPSAFESYFGKFKSMPKNQSQNVSDSITNHNNVDTQSAVGNKYHSEGDVSNFLRSMREESDISRERRRGQSPIGRPPSPPRIRDRSRSPLGHPMDKTSLDSLSDNNMSKSHPEARKRCIHFPHPDKLCHDFFVSGKCSNNKICRFAHHILEPIYIDYCFKYIDNSRKKECSGTYETKCGKPHIGFWKLNREYQREVRRLQLSCKQCGNDLKNMEGNWSDVSSVDESKGERGSNRSMSKEKSPNRFLVKNEIMKGCLSSKSTKCVNCPISDELCITFVGQKCKFFPKCFKAHKIPNRLKIRYCGDFIDPNVYCKGKCGDPHIKFDRLKSMYKEETQMMYKSCSICSNEKASKRSLSPDAPSESSTQSNRSNLLGPRNRSPLPHFPNRRIIDYGSDSEEHYDTESGFTESSSQRSASPRSSSLKDKNSLRSRRNNARTSSNPCKYYQQGTCKKGKDCFFSHIGPKIRR